MNQAVNRTFTASGGATPYSFSVASGSLPSGLSLAATGVLSGSPTQASSFTAVIQARDANGCIGLGPPYVVTITAPPIDLMLNLYARPSTVYGTSAISVVIDVYELNSVATQGSFRVRLTQDAMLNLSFDPTATTVGGRPVQNRLWSFSGPSNGMYTLTSNQPIVAGGTLSFGLRGTLTPGPTKGKVSISATLEGIDMVEFPLTNNSDADRIEYFDK